MVWGVLVHDHGATQFGGAGGIGVLVLIGCLGEGHQDAGRAAHRQFTQAARTGTANRQVGMLQQAGDVVAEAAFHQPGVLQFTHVGIVAPREMHHPTAPFQQLGKHGPHHPVEAEGALASAHHHQQRPRAGGRPVR